MNIDPAVLAVAGTVVGALVTAIVALYKQRSADQDRMQTRITQLEDELDKQRNARVATAESNTKWALEIQQGVSDRLDKLDAIAKAMNPRGPR